MAPRKKATKPEAEQLDEGFDLGSFLNDFGAMAGTVAPEIEENEAVEQLPRWTIIQPKNTYVDDSSYWGKIEVTLDPGEDTRYYTRQLDMMLLGRVSTTSPFTGRIVGRRRMKDGDGNVVCASRNGLYPHRDYLGKAVQDTQFGREYVIGTHDIPGTLLPITEGSICENCPMAQFRNRPTGSGRFAQLCKPNDRYLVWLRPFQDAEQQDEEGNDAWIVPPEGMIAMVTGTNNGLQAALEGTIKRRGKDPAKKYGAGRNKDGAFELFGIEYWFDMEKEVLEVEGTEVPTYRNAPEGQPLQVAVLTKGSQFPDIYPVTVTVVGNNFVTQDGKDNPTQVPHFNLSKTPLSKTEYQAYLKAFEAFKEEELIAGQLSIPEARPEFALPSGDEIRVESPAEDDDVEEGEFVDLDDLT